jgi:hypothetical protein
VSHIQFLVQFDVQSTEAAVTEAITWESMRINMAEVCADTRFRASVSTVRDMTFQIIAQNEDIMAQMDAVIARLGSQ